MSTRFALSRRTFLALSSAAAGSSALSSFAATTNSQNRTAVLPTFPRADFLDAADLTAIAGLDSPEGRIGPDPTTATF